MNNLILIVDDQVDVRMSAAIALSNHGYQCLEAQSPLEALAILKSHVVSLILLDMNFSLDTTSGSEGLNFLKKLKQQNIQLPVVMMTGWASVDIAVQAMQLGAKDFIEKPWKNTRLVSIIKQQLENAQLSEENARFSALSQVTSAEFIAQSPQMLALLTQAKRAALSDAYILITGENGNGKSLLAQYIHNHSQRAGNRFVCVNMGAIPESLFESELFGHKKGAFTDAKENRLGRFDIASNGTLFLDEIGTLPQTLQPKMLRVLETGEYEIVGSSNTQQTNARIIAATNADLSQLINNGEFRRDLLFRLNTIELHIPPLRERIEDIPLLVAQLLKKHGQKYQRPAMTLTPQAEQAILNHQWMGNVRELSHSIERAIIMSDESTLDVNALGLNNHGLVQPAEPPLMTLEQTEKSAIATAIQHFDGNVLAAAQYLGISKSAIYRRIEKYSIEQE